jgi:tRNA 5-methylaminomethyl-2-thiouridine biosynthesis bifunctional protein
MKPVFDVAIVGAGINGCASAHFLTQAGLRVALLDREGIAKGGSGAAGAFISPKVSKSGPLKAVMDAAYDYSLAFYAREFPDYVRLAPQLHIAKFEDENEKVEHFIAHTAIPTAPVPEGISALLHDDVKGFRSVYLKESGVVDAEPMCRALAADAAFFCEEVTAPERVDGGWQVGPVRAKTVLLATGAYEKIIDAPYVSLRGVWGHRIDIRTSTRIDAIIHHRVSLAPTDEHGNSAIGATHNVHYHPQRNAEPYDYEAGRAELIAKATGTVKLENIEILRDFTGLRSGSNDYMPLLGSIVDADATLQAHPELRKGAKLEASGYVNYEGLYMINGTGGYGFVLGPYLAKQFADHLVHGTPVDPALEPSRFFRRWVKREAPLAR